MPHSTRPNSEKYEKILEALRTLLETKKISQISVSEIAQTAGIGRVAYIIIFHQRRLSLMHLWQKATKSRLPPQRSLQSAPIYLRLCAWR